MLVKIFAPRWKELFSKSLADEIVRHSEEIDVYIITSGAVRIKPITITSPLRKLSWKTYGIAIGIISFITIINLFFAPLLSGSTLIMAYILGITIIALFGQMGPSILASLLSIIAYYFFFIPPTYSFAIKEVQYFFTLLVMFLVSEVISHLTILTRRQADIAQFAEQQTAVLHTLSRQLASSRGVDKLLEIGVNYLSQLFNSEIIALLPKKNQLMIRARYKTEQNLDAKELSVAQWVFDLREMAGLGTETLPFSDALYIPLLTPQGSIGVLRVKPIKSGYLFSDEQKNLLQSCASQVALAIEVDRLNEKKHNSKLRNETDRVYNALLQSVSHDLRTPIIHALSMASALVEGRNGLDAKSTKNIGHELHEELEQLNRLINNLLQISYLESSAVKLDKSSHLIKDTINLAVTLSKEKFGERPITVNLPTHDVTASYDAVLIQDVLINLIDNAFKFTPADSPITINVDDCSNTNIIVSVEDKGPGIMPDEVNKLFEKYYRGRLLTTERGLGLGLAICQRIISAHGGEIWAENRSEGGAAFRFTLLKV